MMNRFFKAVLSVIIAMAMIFSCCAGIGATNTNKTSDLEILDDTITLNNNEVYFSSYNITENYLGGASLVDENSSEKIKFQGKDCLDSPQIIKTTPNTKYIFYKTLPGSAGGGSRFTFDNTGGVYRKVRVKLSHYDYFNEDGSHTKDGFDYHFGETEYVGKSSYSSVLIIVSGAAITFVVPDENGFVEFYSCCNIGVRAGYYTTFDYIIRTDTEYSSGGGGGINGGTIKDFAKGCVRNSFVAISDVTEIQFYLSKHNDFDKMKQYRADVDRNNVISIIDATLIQLYLANK